MGIAIDGNGRAVGADEARRLEWLETDGLGGYALSTVSGLSRRRYHGLLVAATTPPAGRTVLLSGLDEALGVDGERFDLGVNQYPGTLHPEGDRFLVSFRHEPIPTWVYEAGGARLERSFFLVHGETTAVVTWRLLFAPPEKTVRLAVRPRLAFRDHHALTFENAGLDPRLDLGPGRVSVRPYAVFAPLVFSHEGAALDRASWWFRDLVHEAERERGFDFAEDAFSPFGLEWELSSPGEVTLVVSTRGRSAAEAPGLRLSELRRRAKVAGAEEDPPVLRALRRAADAFVVARDAGTTVIAGYPWFADWGRDTMISLPGLLLATGRLEEAGRVLRTFERFLDGGLVPNRFPDAGGPPEYHSVDATLWFVEAVRATWRASRDGALVAELFPALRSALEAHERGTRYGIHVDDDGLLASGAPGVPLTWMDAKVGERVVTPRRGKPVEVQALWFNALVSLAEMAGALGETALEAVLEAKADRAMRSFEQLFWNETSGCLADCVGEDGTRDDSVRPNQLLAVSLAHPVLVGERAEAVLSAVERHLLTPLGLRTLAPSDPAYRGRYDGGAEARDEAYHQGTAWPWLIGPYASAVLRLRGSEPKVLERLAASIRPLARHLLGPGLGQLPEVFDGDDPQRSGGCPAQAWSVAELLRVLAARPELARRIS